MSAYEDKKKRPQRMGMKRRRNFVLKKRGEGKGKPNEKRLQKQRCLWRGESLRKRGTFHIGA